MLGREQNVSFELKQPRGQRASQINNNHRQRATSAMETTLEQSAEGLAIVKVLAAVLERLVCTNATLARTDPGQVTKFHALKAPGICIQAYLERVHKYASCSNECFILALIYIDRLIQRNNFLLTELNVHRVVITAILLAAKFFDDAYYNNAYYSKVGGVLVSEMNGLEVDFLFRINFSLHVTPEVFDKYKAELVAHSLNSGVTIPQVPSPNPQIAETSYLNGANLDQWVPMEQVSSASIPMPVPSSHHIPPHVTPSPSHVLAAPPVEPRRAVSNACAHPLAPMVSMLHGGADEQYIVVSNQVFPLQTTLVHHNHGVGNYQEQTGYHHQQHSGNGYPLTRESFGSLAVAGHY